MATINSNNDDWRQLREKVRLQDLAMLKTLARECHNMLAQDPDDKQRRAITQRLHKVEALRARLKRSE